MAANAYTQAINISLIFLNFPGFPLVNVAAAIMGSITPFIVSSLKVS